MSIKIGDKIRLATTQEEGVVLANLVIRRTVWRSGSVTHLRT
jgi:hypothetical protein